MNRPRIARAPHPVSPHKALTGIAGFDQITGGGLPHGRTTLLVGGPGSGKTVLALQFLVQGARASGETGIFVSFEEATARILVNAEGFGWKLAALARRRVHFMDAQPDPDLIQCGDFDLGGLLAALQAKVSAIDARRIVFDGLDVMLAMLPSWSARRREVYRLHAWLQRHGLTSVLTVKAGADAVDATGPQTLGFMQFMVDAVVVLNHRVVQGVSLRTVRIQKYRGSGFDENEAPFLIGSTGIEVAQTRTHAHARAKASRERVSSGIERLDTMLGGGFYRGASVLITGFPGTAKTTLSGAFAQAACQRGEPTLFISFDSECAEIVRNLASVGIRLDAQLKSGRLRMISARTINGSAETYLVTIKALAREHGARCLVIDPVSAWSRSGTDLSANSVVARLIEWTKSSGITLVCTRLYDTSASSPEGSEPLQISTLTDTWIHLSYVVQAGERNRGLSIIKSRGTAHSNQVRELILASRGITLADAYTAGGEVLMGTMRWEKERAVSMANEAAGVAARLRRTRLDAEVAQLEVRTKLLQSGLMAKQQEKSMLGKSALSRQAERSRSRVRMRELRSADAPRAGTR